jgi:hypothetical protein
MFETKVIQNIKTHVSCSKIFFPENRAVYNVEKYGTAGQPTDDDIIGACALHIGKSPVEM